MNGPSMIGIRFGDWLVEPSLKQLRAWRASHRGPALATLLLATTAMAAGSESIEEIIVHGDRMNRSLLSTPASVALFTEEDLRVATDRNGSELFARVPNVTVRAADESIMVRGIPRGGFGGIGAAVFLHG